MTTPVEAQPTVVVLGSESEFSATVLRGLLQANADVAAFVLHQPNCQPPGHHPRLPVVANGSAAAVAVEHNLALIRAPTVQDPTVIDQIDNLQPDILLAACFPQVLTPRWLQLPRMLCLNLHPSLLPSYRGPMPLFWQLREGEKQTGVTLHIMDNDVDAGAIVGQSTMTLNAGTTYSQANAALATLGVELVRELLDGLRAGQRIPRVPQDPILASYQSFPRETDFRFDTHFTAERAYRFIEGVQEWRIPFEVDLGEHIVVVERAIGFRDDAHLGPVVEVDGDRVRIRFSLGTLEAFGRLLPTSDQSP